MAHAFRTKTLYVCFPSCPNIAAEAQRPAAGNLALLFNTLTVIVSDLFMKLSEAFQRKSIISGVLLTLALCQTILCMVMSDLGHFMVDQQDAKTECFVVRPH